LYTPCILDCALRFLIKFSYLSKKKVMPENYIWIFLIWFGETWGFFWRPNAA